jgi:hypothetical protein
MRDGSVVAYRDSDPSHLRQERFRLIYESMPLSFTVYLADGTTFSVDLVRGTLRAGEERLNPALVLTTPLRLIYYKRMYADMSSNGKGPSGAKMAWFALGWQTTTEDGRNLRRGMKVYPDGRVELGDGI